MRSAAPLIAFSSSGRISDSGAFASSRSMAVWAAARMARRREALSTISVYSKALALVGVISISWARYAR